MTSRTYAGAAALLALLGFAGGCLSQLIPLHEETSNNTLDAAANGSADLAPVDTPDLAGQPAPDLAGQPAPDLARPTANDMAQALAQQPADHLGGDVCASCHNGMTAPRWTIGGTLFSAAVGGAGVGGATIEITDANNTVVKMIPTAPNGNFWTDATITFPIKIRAIRGTQTRSMQATVQQADGASCNKSGCHDDMQRINVP
jgi:antitoxin (DNA-binding transcriptional repressor) of toxin-antitoxin stability system